MTTTTIGKNLLCADAISTCIDVVLSEKADLEQIAKATSALKTILQNAMPYLRSEVIAVACVEKEMCALKEIKNTLGNLPSDIFVKALCNHSDLSSEFAHAAVMPALIRAISDLILLQKLEIEQTSEETPDTRDTEENTEEYEDTTIMEDLAELEAPQESNDNDILYQGVLTPLTITTILRKRLKKLIGIVCKNENAVALSKQLFFINEVLGVNPNEFIGDQKCQIIIDEITSKTGEKYLFNRDLTEDVVYRIFHKIRLNKLVEYLTSKPSKKNQKILEELEAKYNFNNTNIFVDDPFHSQKTERAQFVKGLQKYTLETLILTKNFLEEKGLKFYLTEGTLLGAVRHNGFIPWDDDVDIAMPRKDYRKLVKLALEGEIPPELNFDSLETNPKHWVLGAKMQLVRQTPYIQHKVTELSKCNGPYVDIFPLDCWSSPFNYKQRRADRRVKLARRMLFMKTGYSTATKKKKHRILLKFILPFVKNTWIEKFAIKNMTKFYRKNPKYYVNLCSYYPFYKEVFPASFFGEPKYIEFEGEMMPIPCEAEYMLKTIYGKNYDTIPPVRVTNMRKHAFDLREDVKF